MAQISLFEKRKNYSDKDITVTVGMNDQIYITFRHYSWKRFTESDYVRLVADEGMMLKKGKVTLMCVDVSKADVSNWNEVEYVEPDKPAEEEALTRYANELTGKNDPDLVSATESLINKFTEE
jgi:hypothetical protein